MKPLNKVDIIWSSKFAYAIGLIASDGNLSPDGRHINFTTKDKQLAELFKSCLNLNNKIGRKARDGSNEKKYFVVQFGDINFYKFLLSIGLTPKKSKTLTDLKINNKYFNDFIRGCIDGDGNIIITKHPESSKPQLRVRITSASNKFLYWLRNKIKDELQITGYIDKGIRANMLCYGKSESLKLFDYIYYKNVDNYLERKYKLIENLPGWRNWYTR